MSPYFIGRGSWSSWEGVGVARGGGDGEELIQSIISMIGGFANIEEFVNHALNQESGWNDLGSKIPLSNTSGVYPFLVNNVIFEDEFRGIDKAVFLQTDERSNSLQVWQNGMLQGQIIQDQKSKTVNYKKTLNKYPHF